MRHVNSLIDSSVVTTLNKGGIAVIPTDTIYGLVARAADAGACDHVYAAKGRDADKACIVLVADESQIWDAVSSQAFRAAMAMVRDDRPTSIIVPKGPLTPPWLGTDTGIAYRRPAQAELQALLSMTGPLIAPSANPQGKEPAASVSEAMAYFGERVDVYVDGGVISDSQPSRLIQVLPDGTLEYLR